MQQVLNPNLVELASSLAAEFRAASPFRHVLLKDFLALRTRPLVTVASKFRPSESN